MHVRRLLTAFFVLVLLVVALPVTEAQEGEGLSDDELELLAEVNSARDNFLALSTYRYSGTNEIAQVVTSGEGIREIHLETIVSQEISGQVAVDGDTINSSDSIEQEFSLNVNEQNTANRFGLALETITLDGTAYINFTDVPEELPNLPTGWYLLSDLSDLEAFELLDIEGLTNLGSSAVPLYVLDETTVNSITETEIDEEGVRVFVIEVNASTALDGVLDTVLTTDEATLEALDALYEGATVTLTVSVDTEQNIISQIDTVTTIEASFEAGVLGEDVVTLLQESLSSIILGGFNSEVEITAPELASETEEAESE